MVKRIIGEAASATVYVRIAPSLKEKMNSAADSCGLSTAKWLAEAIQEKLDRDSSCSSAAPLPAGIDRDVLRAVIREELEKMEKEEAAHGAL